jgi:hypothetical protein
MKRVFLLAAVVIVASTWPRPARAQLGIPNLGLGTDIGIPRQDQKIQLKQQPKKNTPPPPVVGASRGTSSRSARSNIGSLDRFGRIDMLGKPVKGYPAIRGDLSGPTPTNVSRGGANGQGGKVKRGRR